MAEPRNPPEDTLACGTSVASLVDQADAGHREPVGVHQTGCPHCRSALREAVISRQALELLRATDGPAPSGLPDRIMTEVRRHRHSSALIDLSPAGRRHGGLVQIAGEIRVRPQVVADLARVAASAVPGVAVARSTAAGRPGPPGGVDIALGLLVDGRTPLPDVARRVRLVVRSAVRRALGAGQVEVELTALDLLAQS